MTATMTRRERREGRERRDLDPRTRFVRACVIGGVLGGVVFTWMLTRGSFDFLRWDSLGDFYDAQARSLMAGRLDMSAEVLGIEAFKVGTKNHMYFGPVPALLRVPVLALFGRGLDGRLTSISVLAAWAVAVVFVCRLHWKARTALRGHEPLDRVEMAMIALFTFVVAGGSSFVFLASRLWVPHEAILWAVAFALVAMDALVGHLTAPSARRLLVASAFASAALLTRVTTGVGPVAAIAAIAGAALLRRVLAPPRPPSDRLAWLGSPAPPASPIRLPLVVASAVAPVLLFVAVNVAKFGTLFSVPYTSQRLAVIDRHYRSVLDANGGTLFGLDFTPTLILRYLRPDGIGFQRLFPFVDFATVPAPVVGGARFALIDRSASVTVSQMFLFVLAVAGVVMLVRSRSWQARAPLRPFLLPTVAAALSTLGVLVYAYVFERFAGEFIPVLVIAGALGLQGLLRARADHPRPRWVTPVIVVLVPIAAFTTWANFGLGVAYGRLWSNNVPPSVAAGFLAFQDDVSDALGGGPRAIDRLPALPAGSSPPGRLVVIGDCDGLYVSGGVPNASERVADHWNLVELSGDAGHLVLEVRFPRRPVGTRLPIFTAGDATDPQILYAEYLPEDRVRLVHRGTGDFDGPLRAFDAPIDFDHTYRLDVHADVRLELLRISLDDVVRGNAFYFSSGADLRVGRNTLFPRVEPEFGGFLRRERVTTPLCRELVREAAAG